MDSDSGAFVSLKHLLAFCVLSIAKAGTSTRAEAVLTPPSWPLAPWLDGTCMRSKGDRMWMEKRKEKVTKTGREIHCWKTLTLGIDWNLGLHSAVTKNESRSGDESQANIRDEGMENIAALSRRLYAVTVDTGVSVPCAVGGVSILIKYGTSKGILLRSVRCSLMELLFSPSALPTLPSTPPQAHIFHPAAKSLQNGSRTQEICTTELPLMDIWPINSRPPSPHPELTSPKPENEPPHPPPTPEVLKPKDLPEMSSLVRLNSGP